MPVLPRSPTVRWFILFGLALALVASNASGVGNVVIQEIYGGGGNTSAVYRNDYVVLYNRSSQAQSLGGWSLQYASNTGSTWSRANITNFTLQPGQFYLIVLASGGAIGQPLPVTPDATGTFNISATGGKLALVRANTTITTGTLCPIGGPLPIEDFIGYGAADCFESAPGPGAPVSNNSTSTFRQNIVNGCVDTDSNALDCVLGAPVCRNTTLSSYCIIACCANNTCTIVPTPAMCTGLIKGNVTCTPNPCPGPAGACCLGDGSCFSTDLASCTLALGVFNGVDTLCFPSPCLGACCEGDNICTILSGDDCFGDYQGLATTCSPTPCPIVPTGACCLSTGACITATSATTCPGTFLGLASVCAPNPCPLPPGACCLPDGSCISAIDDLSCPGVFQGSGTSCGATICPVPFACCSTTVFGTCTIRANMCQSNEIHTGTTCTPNPCSIPPGACCLFDGSCLSAADAAQCSGTFQGANTTCSSVNCPQPIACCATASGTCTLRQGECAGNEQASGNTCLPNPCSVPGVCCVGSTCQTISQTQCSQLSYAVFVITKLTCPGTVSQPCCKADFNHVNGITVQDIFDFLSAWFATNPISDFNQANGVGVQDIFDFLAAWFLHNCS